MEKMEDTSKKKFTLVGRGDVNDLSGMMKSIVEMCDKYGIKDAKVTVTIDPNEDKDEDVSDTAQGEPKPDQKSNEYSKNEKFVLCEVISKEKKLPFDLEPVTCANGAVEYMYKNDPGFVRAAVMACKETKLLFDMKEIYDIHSKQVVTIEQLRILRYKGRNIVVSPYYTKSGGMLVDLIDKKDVDDGKEIIANDVEGYLNEDAD